MVFEEYFYNCLKIGAPRDEVSSGGIMKKREQQTRSSN